ncbi:hypothetical protein [Alkalinema sp. FACHB-956]|uniref:hypothetical protein n=1 Tax=Alkalinema sp. FACHB-956 TaxID=2692768 RepID=UPI0016883AAA|nr:hypothetical protein [Alkalinema sp. FACHB-956]MBD2327258.1 hypothetical protein [Alkalinema sp. FACHB-956]
MQLVIQALLHWRQPICSTIAFLLGLGIVCEAQPIVQRPESACDAEALLTSRQPLVEIHPETIIMKPWQGKHQVYGIFMLPKAVQSREPAILKVKHIGVYCDVVNRSGFKREGVIAKRNHFLMVDHIHTRTAFWFLLLGKADLIQNPDNWTLIYVHPAAPRPPRF